MKRLTPQEVESFVQDGVLVVENILSPDELSAAQAGCHQTLREHSVDPDRLAETGHCLRPLSSTNGSGGVLDLFYDDWKMKLIATNATLFQATCQLWEAGYCHDNQEIAHLDETEQFKWHPYGSFECTKGYMYIDRIGYRIPTILAQELGAKAATLTTTTSTSTSVSHDWKPKPKRSTTGKTIPIQRSLTPHLDCCPATLYTSNLSGVKKWRPIQCFVALSDALEPNQGGFEAVRGGFHRDFDAWAQTRASTIRTTASHGTQEIPAPCLGEYTHIRPVEDADVMARIRHVPARAGSAVFWDTRVPHANSYRHNGTVPRTVVYCSFLPDVPVNRQYCQAQLDRWMAGRNPTDQWIRSSQSNDTTGSEQSMDETQRQQRDEQHVKIQEMLATPLARRLAGWDPWED